MYIYVYIYIHARRNQGFGGLQPPPPPPPPRFWLKLIFYQLTIIVKSKKELKNINQIKFLVNYW